MNEHFALSKAQKDYLNGHITLKNPTTEKSRIRKKAIQSWSIFVPILKSNVVDTEWKLSLFQSPTTEESQKLWNVHNKLFGFEEFLDVLLKIDSDNPSYGDALKIKLARVMITKSISYYSQRYEISEFIHQEIQRFNNLMIFLEDSIESQRFREREMKMYFMRKKQTQPPHIVRDKFYHALCMHCYRYSLGISKTEDDAIETLTHDENCSYNERYEFNKNDSQSLKIQNETYLRIFTPL
jgi:hypothetical protein